MEVEVRENFLVFVMFLMFLSILQAVTLHTDLGDIKIELFCERTPRACEVNVFLTLTLPSNQAFYFKTLTFYGPLRGKSKTIQHSIYFLPLIQGRRWDGVYPNPLGSCVVVVRKYAKMQFGGFLYEVCMLVLCVCMGLSDSSHSPKACQF